MVPTGDSAGSMKAAVGSVAGVGLRLAYGEPLRPADEDGRIPMGYRMAVATDVPAAHRALEMLLAKLDGRPFESEVALPESAEPVPPAAPVADLSTTV